MRRTTRLLAPPLLAALLLAGCTPSDPMPTPPPTSDAAPVFATDEEALAAAEAAYGKYLATVDAILADGGQNPERLEPLVSPEVYDREVKGFESYVSKGWRGTGTTSFSITLQRFDEQELTAYVCEDLSATDVIDQSGSSVVPPDRPLLYAFQVDFKIRESLILTAKAPWDGDGVCASL